MSMYRSSAFLRMADVGDRYQQTTRQRRIEDGHASYGNVASAKSEAMVVSPSASVTCAR